MVFDLLNILDEALWSYLGVPAIMLISVWLGFKSRFVQVRKFGYVLKTFWGFLTTRNKEEVRGVHPLQAFFACIGGCVGVGNVVSICTAVQIGGPGALFWIWVTAIFGMLIKYAEVYLGMKYRVQAEDEGYTGGPQYYLRKVFKGQTVPKLAALLLCVYGVEVYQFSVVTHSVSYNFGFDQTIVTLILLVLIIFAGWGGVRRVGNISAWVIPLFVLLYVGMGGWVLYQNLAILPEVLGQVFHYAFSPAGAIGGFVGSGMMLTISQGVKRSCYTADLGVGYASVIHSESSVLRPEKQASLVIFDIFIDTFILCTTSVVLILATGVWHQPLDASMLVQTALSMYFPHMDFFMPFFLLFVGYSTINAYFVVGLKCANFLSPKRGKILFNLYAIAVFLLFSLIEAVHAQMLMALAGGILLIINCYGIFKLRHEIGFDIDGTAGAKEKPPELVLEA